MIDGKLHEPMEFLIIEVPDTYVGPVMEKLGSRKGELINMGTREGGVTHIEFRIPSRGLMGYRPEFLTDTNGNGIMNHVFDGYEPYKGEIVTRHQGSLIAFETGETVTYGLYAAQERGRLFIGPGVPVYEGMIVGASPKSEDITVNVCKKSTSQTPVHRVLMMPSSLHLQLLCHLNSALNSLLMMSLLRLLPKISVCVSVFFQKNSV